MGLFESYFDHPGRPGQRGGSSARSGGASPGNTGKGTASHWEPPTGASPTTVTAKDLSGGKRDWNAPGPATVGDDKGRGSRADLAPGSKAKDLSGGKRDWASKDDAPAKSATYGISMTPFAVSYGQHVDGGGNVKDLSSGHRDWSTRESNSATSVGMLMRNKYKAKIEGLTLEESANMHRMLDAEDMDEAVVSDKVRKRTQTLPGGGFPMPDLEHARLALQDLPKAKGLSTEDKAKIKARAHAMLGKAKESEYTFSSGVFKGDF